MAEFKLGRIKFVWRGQWVAAREYLVDDVVRNGGQSYICVSSHTASTLFATDLSFIPTKWNLVSGGTNWAGDWDTSIYYNVGDQVSYGGVVYICTEAHVSASTELLGLEDDSDKWDAFAASFLWRNDWTTATRYRLNDLVQYGGTTYVCNTPHVSATTTSTFTVLTASGNGTNATLTFASQIIPPFTVGSTIVIAGINPAGYNNASATVISCTATSVTYANTTTTAYSSGGTVFGDTYFGLEKDQTKWSAFNNGITYVGDWSALERYKLGDVVKYGASTWICTAFHTSTAAFDNTKWEQFTEGLQFESTWSDSTIYQIGDTVIYGGYSYIAKTNNTNKNPRAESADWEVYTTGFNFQGDWSDVTDYLVGDVVRLGGYTYLAVEDNTDEIPPNATYWSRLNSGNKWKDTVQVYTNISAVTVTGSGINASFDVTRSGTVYSVTINNVGQNFANGDTLKVLGNAVGGLSPVNDVSITVTGATLGEIDTVTATGASVTWTTASAYVLGDLVFFGASTYICTAAHTASSLNRPDADTTATYWNLFAGGAASAVLTTPGDTYYYGEQGPTRLPIGSDGQILRVRGTYPAWAFYGVINNLVYVSPTGVDDMSEGRGLTIDKPWKSVRFATDQIERGYQNTNAKSLLEKNKLFMMREVTNWITYTYTVNVASSSNATNLFTADTTENLTVGMPIEFSGTTGGVTAGVTYFVKTIPSDTTFSISNTQTGIVRTLTLGSTPMTGTLSYDSATCERDTGYLVDALIFDISHGGNGKTTIAANAYYTRAGSAYINSNFGQQLTQTVAAYNYLKVLVSDVLSNTLSDNYQDLNNVAYPAEQIIDSTLTAEFGAVNTSVALLNIVTDGLLAGSASAIPAAIFPNSTVSVKTGTYFEVLPITVPNYTAIVGDELRGTVINPQPAIKSLVNDKPKTISALERIKSVIPNLISNATIVPTVGNTEPQQYIINSNESTAEERVRLNVGTMLDVLSTGITELPTFVLPTPTGGTGNAFTAGYLDAARLVYANKAFLQAEVSAWIDAQIAANTSPFNGFTYAGTDRTKCERDVGYIVDALRYDLTYGGNLATVIAARSYYANGVLVEVGEEEQAKAVQLRIKDIIDNIVTGNTAGWTKTPANVLTQNVSGTAGSAPAATFAQARIQEIHNTIDTGVTPTTIAPDITWTAAGLQTFAGNINSTEIQSAAIAWVNHTYPTFIYNTTTCARDAGYIIDALKYDMLLGSNFLSIWNAMSYYRGLTSTDVVLNSQLSPTLGLLGFVGASVLESGKAVTGITGNLNATAYVDRSIDAIYSLVNDGIGALPTEVMTDPSNADVDYVNAKAQIAQNYAFIKADVSKYIEINFPAIWSSIDQATCQRDIGYVLDAIRYDLTYGGNTQSLIAGSSYYTYINLVIDESESVATLAAYAHLKSIIKRIAQRTSITPQSGNAVSQVISGTGDVAGAAGTFAENRVQDIYDWIDNGVAPTRILPNDSWVDSNLVAGFAELQARKAEIQSDGLGYVEKFFQELSFNRDTCSRDIGYMVDAIGYDAMFNSNFASITVGRSYNRAISSAVLVLAEQKSASLGLINFLKYKIQGIIVNGAIAKTSTVIDNIVDSINGGATPKLSWPSYSTVDAENYAAAKLIWENKSFVEAEVLQYISNNYPAVEYNKALCARDVGYIIDAIRYDLTYGGNVATRQSAISYYSQITDGLQIDSNDLTATINAYGQMKTVIQAISQNGAYSALQNKVARLTGPTGDATSATTVGTLIQNAINYITDPDANPITESLPSTSWVSPSIVSVHSLLQTNKATIQAQITTFIATNYPNLVYNSAICERDVGYIIDGIGYDLMFNSNYRSVKAGMSYYQAQASLVIGDQKRATLQSYRELAGIIASYANTNTVAIASIRANMAHIINILDKGVGMTPETHGSLAYRNNVSTVKASEIIKANTAFLAAESTAWIRDQYTSTVISTTTPNVFTTSTSHNFVVGDPVQVTSEEIDALITQVATTGNLVTFQSTTGFVANMKVSVTGIGIGLLTGGTYYIKTIESDTTVTLSSTVGGTAIDPGTASGLLNVTVGGPWAGLNNGTVYYIATIPTATSFTLINDPIVAESITVTAESGVMNIGYAFNDASCKRDMAAYIDGIVYDMIWPGNYKSTKAALLYNNAVAGSQRSDMFWVSNSTGLRNCTLRGLIGDLTEANTYGTKRPTAGAFVALNPGFGPNDREVWVQTRSHYSQNVSMFGTGCTGAKIDSSLHAGGNKSMVKNDFTTIISDGIGVWCTGAGSLTELVSVFNYYGYAGYIADKGGRIRATNGNSSYGTYGVIAEGISSKETPLYGNVNNQGAQAQITNTVTDGLSEILRLEFENTGVNYTNAAYTINGSGFGATAIGDEFRDGTVFQTRIIDADNGEEVGGTSYGTAANAGQSGDTTSITIAATDQALSSAYVGMRIQITAGTGVGQFANIATYETGSKIATVTKPSTGAPGWDHVVPGTPIESALDLTTTYIIEPQISFTGPGYTATARTLAPSATWKAMTYGDNRYVAISGTTLTSYSTNGTSWTQGGALASSSTWVDVVYGGGQGATATAIVGGLGGRGAQLRAVLGVANTTGLPTADQISSVEILDGGQGYLTPPVIVFTPVSGGLGALATCQVLDGKIINVTIVVPGSGYTVAPTVVAATDRITKIIVNSWGSGYTGAPQINIIGGGGSGTTTTAVVTNEGVSRIKLTDTNTFDEDQQAFAGFSGTGYTSTPTVQIVDTSAKFVAIASGSGNNCYNTTANINSTWTAGSSTGKTSLASIAYGGGYYVAVGGTNEAVRSVTGAIWTNASSMPTLGAGTWKAVAYGNGTFIAISTGSNATAKSSNGLAWTSGTVLPASTTWASITYGNGRFVAIASSGTIAAVSYDKGTTWVQTVLPQSVTWTKVSYGQGLFFAIASGTAVCATSPDGVLWTEQAMPSSSGWIDVQFGNINKRPLWTAISGTTGTIAASIRTGATATGRVKVGAGSVVEVRMVEPGSGYPYGTVSATTATTNLITVDNTVNLVNNQPIEFLDASGGGLVREQTYYVIGSTITSTQFKVASTSGSTTPVVLDTAAISGMTYRAGPITTLTDPSNVENAVLRVRLGDGGLGNPSFSNRGTDNTTATTDVLGDGYSDLFQVSTFVNVYGLSDSPTPGANVEFASIPGAYYKLVTVTNYVQDLKNPGTYTATFQINPGLTTLLAPLHGDRVTTRLAYSQVRLTGHDFLYIGTGGFDKTNYPNVDITTAIQDNQANFSGGGRVFFTSTDQDGNFNVGNLFGVQQATGTATLNASAFNLSGLNSLQLGSVSLGIGSAIITQFSTDPFFTADSDNIVPTQRAIRAYITAQIGGGQSSLNVNTLTSGVIYVAGNSISTTTGAGISVTSKMNFTGGIDGAPVALGYFLTR